jgi:hypothetical protein
MNARLIRFVTAVASAALVSVMGAGVANAAATEHTAAHPVAGHAATVDASTYLRQLHTYLAGAERQGDVAAVQAAVEQLRPVLKAVSRASVDRSSLTLNDQAGAQAAQVARDLPGLSVLAPLGALLNSLLATVQDLITGLLGGLPVPIPVPELPQLPPLPGVPTPDLPVPDLPVPGGR